MVVVEQNSIVGFIYNDGEMKMYNIMFRKKQRGQTRKLNTVFKCIDNFNPFINIDTEYEHFHFPGGFFIAMDKTSGKIKTAFCRKWLQTTEKFIMQKPKDISFCKVVAVISDPNYYSSQIIIFYSEEYYNSFWDRNGPYQFWTPIQSEYSFCRRRNIKTFFAEKGYHERLVDEEMYETDLWYYGELPND